MAKVQTVTVDDEMRDLYDKTLMQRDRFSLGVIQAQRRVTPRTLKEKLRGRTLFSFLRDYWAELTPEEKEVWRAAGAASGLSGWQLFVADNAQRIRADLPLGEPPADEWQVLAAHARIEAPASELIVTQAHPATYMEAVKVRGRAWKKEAVRVTEPFSLPLTVSCSYTTALEATGETQVARFYARVWSSYQGRDIFTDAVIPLLENTDWVQGSATVSAQRGIILGYVLVLEIVGYRGDVWLDNIKATHGGTNWARDTKCNEVQKIYTRGFAEVAPHWVALSQPAGAYFSSLYPLA